MAYYRCYLMTSDQRIVGVEAIFADTDDAALAKARRVVGQRPFDSAFELWQLSRRVHVELRQTA
jgi:hypothetical protein